MKLQSQAFNLNLKRKPSSGRYTPLHPESLTHPYISLFLATTSTIFSEHLISAVDKNQMTSHNITIRAFYATIKEALITTGSQGQLYIFLYKWHKTLEAL